MSIAKKSKEPDLSFAALCSHTADSVALSRQSHTPRIQTNTSPAHECLTPSGCGATRDLLHFSAFETGFSLITIVCLTFKDDTPEGYGHGFTGRQQRGGLWVTQKTPASDWEPLSSVNASRVYTWRRNGPELLFMLV